MVDSHCKNKNNEEVIFLLLLSADNWSPAVSKISESVTKGGPPLWKSC